MIIHEVHRERLLDVVPHLVHRDVEALVVHPVSSDAGAQAGLLPAHSRRHRVAGPRDGLNVDVRLQIRRALRLKPSLVRISGIPAR